MDKTKIKQKIIQAHGHKHPDGLVEPVEAADIVRMSPTTLATMRSRGGGPPWVKSGRYVYYPLDDLAEWFVSRSVEKR
jgi:hypothetical protein